jgi:response regulator of citrate/malate metabolism
MAFNAEKLETQIGKWQEQIDALREKQRAARAELDAGLTHQRREEAIARLTGQDPVVVDPPARGEAN